MNNNTITCPFCAEEISRNDTKCKFCEEDLIELDKTNKSKKNNDIKKYCPTCKEQVHEKAIVCKFCNTRLTPLNASEKISNGLLELSNLLYIFALCLLLYFMNSWFGWVSF